MKPLVKILAAVLAAGVATAASAHARLLSSEPANGATLAAPAKLTLHYNEAVEPAVSRLKLAGPGAQGAVELPKPSAQGDDAKTLSVALPALKAGAYVLQWSTMGHDGHRTHGEVRFTVK